MVLNQTKIEEDISFSPVCERDFEDFKTLRKSVMREHVERQGLAWDEEAEDRLHRELFDQEGLRTVLYKGKRVGYAGVRYEQEENRVVIGRLCFYPEYQGRGIGAAMMKKLFKEPICRKRKLFMEVMRANPAVRLYERLGFIRTGDDGKMIYYERVPLINVVA